MFGVHFIVLLLFVTVPIHGYSSFSALSSYEEEDLPVATKTLEDYKLFPISEAFDLQTTDFYSSLTQGNAIIDKESAEECFRLADTPFSKAGLEISSDKRSTYQSVAKEVGLSTEFTYYVTLKASLQAISSSIEWKESTVKTSNIDYSSHVSTISLESACIRKHFTNSFIRELSNLESNINNPKARSSWKSYENFIKRYGSHIISKITFGARLQYFTATQESQHFSDDVMGARACADVEGTISEEAPFKVQGCSSYSTNERKTAQQYNMQVRRFIRGGTKELRNKLLVSSKLDPKLVEEFINTAENTPQPIQYTFIPIWDLFPSDMHQQKANLFAYYTGYIQHHCDYIIDNGYIIQEFRKDPSDYNSFQCVVQSQGCHSDDDCHYSYGKAGCQCGGPTCVEYYSSGRPYIKNEPSGSIWDPVSQKCKYRFLVGCYCENDMKTFVPRWPVGPMLV